MKRLIKIVMAITASSPLVHAEAASHPCKDEQNDTKRLACFDRAFSSPTATDGSKTTGRAATVSALSERWELLPEHKKGTFKFQYHAPIYILPVSYTDSVNRNPSSPSRGSVSDAIAAFGADELEWQQVEAKFQLSFKVKAIESLYGDNGDIWFGYTQKSFWQVFNKDVSAPFRETNYSPEVFNTWRTDIDVIGTKLRMVNFGLVHQSNGKSGVVSRSWNRLYAQAGFERGDLSVLVRPWYRLKEDEDRDDNPDIENYVGRGDLIVAYKFGEHVISAAGRHSLRGGDDNHGSLQLDWAIPITGSLKAHMQAFTGYGESLIDYNHRHTSFGVGISLAEWL